MIKITTDSTCDLPRSLLEQHDITVIPLGIVKAGRLYQDGVDIRIEDIAAHVDAGGLRSGLFQPDGGPRDAGAGCGGGSGGRQVRQ